VGPAVQAVALVVEPLYLRLVQEVFWGMDNLVHSILLHQTNWGFWGFLKGLWLPIYSYIVKSKLLTPL
jgi:hypothetical protein